MVDRSTTGKEIFFDENEIIVSKTDLKGHLTYCNTLFLKLAGYMEHECLGQPHSMIRHPEMPRSVFKLLWDTIQNEEEIFAYVVNRAKNGDHYWVLAHVTISKDETGKVIGYHSNRRAPKRDILDNTIRPLYRELCAIEKQHNDRKAGLEASTQKLMETISGTGMEYGEFVAGLSRAA
ncbi:PAS domain-containing protein [Sneathiella marina]|uniref:PAS domain-containing protein n=1 Tax=Sneathiella marina TaxID=2950108 RepID=A0ABY4W109_9PROT|nr:PAS domain-containing protein [Sneathiella marina]USG60768.1 PAS domain-containing protein [Sneathiella marina]